MPELPDPKVHAHPHKRRSAAKPSEPRTSVRADLPGLERPRELRPVGPWPFAARCSRGGTSYAELAVTSNFTFLTGASHPDELVDQAAFLGYRAVALTDRNSLAGVVRAHVAAKDAGIRFVVGCRLELTEPRGMSLLVYPTHRKAYGRLCRLLTLGKRRAPKGECFLTLNDLIQRQEGLLAVVLPPAHISGEVRDELCRLQRVFDDDRLSIAVTRLFCPEEQWRLDSTVDLAADLKLPLVAVNDVYYHLPARRPLQDVLTCIRHLCTLSEAGYRLFPNGERYLKEPKEMARLFADYPEAVARTIEIAERAAGFNLDELGYEYPDETCPPGMTPMAHVKQLTWEGAKNRYPNGTPEKVRREIEHEFALIEELNYAPYFLTVHDLVSFARSRGILYQGRGAAANSAVCYCLGVTSVDPDRIDVLFERFVSRERDEPPDIDIDFEHERREEVIQYIYEKYGRDRAGLTAEVITYRRRSAVRDVGKALGLSLDAVDRIAKRVDSWEQNPFADSEDGSVPAQLAALGFDADDPTIRLLIELVQQIHGFPRHLSQHVGGFVMTRGPLCELVPIENAAMEARTVIEWDKDDIEAMGMLKVDVLGLGMLTVIQKCFDLLKRDEGTKGRRDEGMGNWTVTDSNSTVVIGEWCEREDISRPYRLAEERRFGEGGLPDNTNDAGHRALRVGPPNAPSSGLDCVQHCGGECTPDSQRLHPLSCGCSRVACGTRNPNRHRGRAESAEELQPPHRASRGNGSPCSSPDPKSPEQEAGHQFALTRPSVPSSLSEVPAEDPRVYDMICKADTLGVFQIESRAQMTMLPRLQPRCFYDLVIEVAIVRPGPIVGDMVHPYLRRRNGEEPVTYPDEIIREVLGKTLGVPLFQEQVMALAIKAAGFTPGEAEKLRRAITAWTSKDDISRYPARFIGGMLKNGYSREFAEWCFQRLKGFSQYGFPESHAASFALLVYASAWLKCYYPAAFAAALLNSQPMGFYAPAQIVRDAQEHGVEIRPVDVNHSDWDCTLEDEGRRDEGTEKKARRHEGTKARRPKGPRDERTEGRRGGALRLGMRMVKRLREEDARAIAEAVKRNGPFATPFELWQTSEVSASSLRTLALADAFGSMHLDRQHALWELQALHGKPLPLLDRVAMNRQDVPLPPIPPFDQVEKDYQRVGLSLKAHPLSFLRQMLARRGVITAAEAKDERRSPFGRRVAVAGLVLFRQRPGTAKGVIFMTLEDETGRVDLIVRPSVSQRYRGAAVYAKLVIAKGRVERQGRVVHVLPTEFTDIEHLVAALPSLSRDFR